MSERIRIGIYVLVLIAGGVAVAFGIMDAGTVDQVSLIVAGLIGVGGAGTAIKHVRPATTQTVVAIQDVLDALADSGGKHRADPRADDVQRVNH